MGEPMRFIPSVLNRLVLTICSFSLLSACSTEAADSGSTVLSHSTQVWRFASGSSPLSLVGSSGSCAVNLPASFLSQGYCFNEVPAAEITVSETAQSAAAYCVATHLPGMAPNAAALLVDANGNYVSEVNGSGSRQTIDVLKAGRYRLYVGFPTAAAGQKVTLRVALLSQFSLQAPACNLR